MVDDASRELKAPPELPSEASPADIRELVDAMLENRVWTVLDVPADLALTVFLPIAFGAFNNWPERLRSEVCVFAVTGKHRTLPTAINGYPVFTEIGVWRSDDFARAVLVAARAGHAKKAAIDAAIQDAPRQ